MANNLHIQNKTKKRKKDRKASIGNEEENRDEMLFCVLPAGRLSLCVDHTIYIYIYMYSFHHGESINIILWPSAWASNPT